MASIQKFIRGTEYSYDISQLMLVGKDEKGLMLAFRGGCNVHIDVSDTADKDRQYKEIQDAMNYYLND